MPGAVDDPPEFFDVDVDQLAWSLALVAAGWLETEPAELAHPDPGEDARDGRERHRQDFGDLRPREPHPAERGDRLDPLITGAMRNPMWRRGAVKQPELAIVAVATHPFAGAADADLGGRGRLAHRPLTARNPTAELPTTFQTERRVSVKLHPGSSFGTEVLGSSQPPRGPGWTNLLRNYS